MQYGESLTQYLTEIGLTESEVKKFNASGGNRERQIDVLKKADTVYWMPFTNKKNQYSKLTI